jgi:hypothetical protein
MAWLFVWLFVAAMRLFQASWKTKAAMRGGLSL